MMKKKFLKLYESTMDRLNRGGYLVGDIVKFKDDAHTHDFYTNCSEEIRNKIMEYMESGDTLRIKNITNVYPAVLGAGNTDDAGSVNVEVCRETAPGRFDQAGILVHPDMLTIIDVYPNLTPVPDKFKRKEKITITPEEVKDEEGEEVPFYSPKLATRRSDVHGKMEAGDRVLTQKNIPVTTKNHNAVAKDPSAYVYNYLPKKS
jgi:hypothetical protein